MRSPFLTVKGKQWLLDAARQSKIQEYMIAKHIMKL